jgi:hypothetical protein
MVESALRRFEVQLAGAEPPKGADKQVPLKRRANNARFCES